MAEYQDDPDIPFEDNGPTIESQDASEELSVIVKDDQDNKITTVANESERKTSKLKRVQQGILKSWWESRPLSPVIYNAIKGTPFYDIFVERFVDDFAPDNHSGCGKSDALRAAGEVRIFSPLLTQAFQAASTIYFGQGVGDRRVISAGQVIYDRLLRSMQQAINHPEQSRSEGLLAAVCVAIALESLRNTSAMGPLIHLFGALQLMEHRGPYSHKYGMEHMLFTEMLPYWVSATIVARKPTFLATRQWKTIPWSGEGASKDIAATLMEHIVDLPGILYQSDQLALAALNGTTSAKQQELLWQNIANLEADLQKWKVEWVDSYASGSIIAVEFQSKEHFPVFQYQDLITGEIITPLPLVYPDPQLPRVLCFYYSAMILLGSVDSRPEHRIQKYEQFAYACLICRSMKYYMHATPGNMINRMVFPITVAHAALPDGGVERAFVREVSRIIETRKSLTSWAPLLEETKIAYQSQGSGPS